MKLSLTWIFDHIQNITWQSVDISKLIERFNNTTAEIESCDKISFNLDSFGLAFLTQQKDEQLVLYCPEWNSTFTLPSRKDAGPQTFYLVKRENKQYRYATLHDFHGEKEDFMPPLGCSQELMQGRWKDACVKEDYVIEIDNTSLTHRPDLWSHRGIAREIAALLDAALVPEEDFLVQRVIKSYERRTGITDDNPLTLEIDEPALCDRFAGLFLSSIDNSLSLPFVAQRLTCVGARPLNALVDATNYVMYDIGQPMHAFDAATFTSTTIKATRGHEKQQLELLDGQVITLTSTDCIIAQGNQPIALAGIMGGARSSVSLSTKQVLVESAHFDPAGIRRSSIRHKKRTEASSRFEKGLDPNQNTTALMRFLGVLNTWGIAYQASKEIVSLGHLAQERTLTISHEFIEKKIGIKIQSREIVSIVSKLGFGVHESISDEGQLYTITVPTYRLRDIVIQDDLVEEIVRCVGYDTIHYRVPLHAFQPVDNQDVFRIRDIKRHCAFALGMHEVASYPLYDEEFLRVLDWQPSLAVEVANAPSEHRRRMVTSLIPHLFKALSVNSGQQQPLRFFEWSKVWKQHNDRIDEQYALAAVWYDPDKDIDFYTIKTDIMSLFGMLGMPVTWQKRAPMPSQSGSLAWSHPYQTAQLQHDSTIIGYAGMVSPVFLSRIVSGNAFVLELDGEFLRDYKKPPVHVRPLSKYPCTELDISVLAPFEITVADLEAAITRSDSRIRDIYLVDYYEKHEWHAQRSVTLRYKLCDESKTVTKEDIDKVTRAVQASMKAIGVTVR